MAVFGGSGDSAAVSSQFYDIHHNSSQHAKYQCCNPLFGRVPMLVLKSVTIYPLFVNAFKDSVHPWIYTNFMRGKNGCNTHFQTLPQKTPQKGNNDTYYETFHIFTKLMLF